MLNVARLGSRSGAGSSLVHSTSQRTVVSGQGRPFLICNQRTFQTGTTKNLNSGPNSNSSNAGKPLVGGRINLDEKTRMRMDLRKDVAGANNSNNTSGSNKWAPPPGQAARAQDSQYRRAVEEHNQGGSSYGSNNARRHNQQQQPQPRRERYVDQGNSNNYGQQQQRGGARSNNPPPPSSFSTSSAWGFSAPTPTPKPQPAAAPAKAPPSFATSAQWGFTPPAAKPKAIAQPAVNKPVSSSPPTTSTPKASETANPSTTSTTSTTNTATQVRPAVENVQIAATLSPQPTFSKSTRTAKENAKIEVAKRSQNRKPKQKPAKDVFIPEAVTVSNLAGLLGARIGHFENTMKALGMEITRHDHILTAEDASLLALEYNVNPIIANTESLFDLTAQPEPEDMSIYPLRPPVVTIMGHVDHGKTTLLDSLRKTSVAAGEAGGITQHIGAFSVLLPSKQRITFLDTPGHAAFSAMRARGAQTTDIVVLVVAAEDGVMPQTAEAIKHAEEAGVPIIVAINKCDKYGAEPDKAKQALLQYGITVEDLGGETQCIEVSGLTGKNLDKLEEAILTLAEVLDLRAENKIRGEGHIIESQVEKGRGNVATVLVKRGTLKVGDTIVAGDAWCKVKALVNDTGKSVKDAPPGTPVKVMGWKDLPMAGDEMLGAESEEQAKLVMTNRALKKEHKEQLKTLVAINEKRRKTAEEEDDEKLAQKEFKRKTWLFHQGVLDTYPEPIQVKKQLSVAAMQAKEEEESEVKHLRMVVKGDVSGTVEAVCDALSGLPANQVKVSVIQHGVGNVTESDIQFAANCNAMVLGFNVKADKKLMQTARQMGVGLKSFNVIYKLLDDVKIEMATLLPKDIEIQVVGEAKIAQVFPIKMKSGQNQNVAGCRIINGGVTRKEDVRIVRDGEVIWDGRLSTLKRIKEDIQEAKKGTECGMEFDGFQDFKEGDVIQSVKKIEVLRKL
ncbi:hypothetical protein BGZ83_006199 [Gryganskiella cystojenkinii]|nr:hypothetical protein BGZ83_006199 [Gryganskiella cystojenkinii]